MNNIKIIQGDITQAEVDAIVNAANQIMLGGGGVDGAIHKAAGPELLKACEQIEAINGIRCPTGEARITPAGNLKAKHVIHTVGPRYGIDKPEDKLLESAYQNSLMLAVEHNCKSVALPAISCGVYGYPFVEAARIAITTCKQTQFSSLQIQFFIFGEELYQIWTKALIETRE